MTPSLVNGLDTVCTCAAPGCHAENLLSQVWASLYRFGVQQEQWNLDHTRSGKTDGFAAAALCVCAYIVPMIEWLTRVEASLADALEMADRGGVIQRNLYMLATVLYSEEMHTNNEVLLQEMSSANEKQVQYEWSVDEESKFEYKFHYVSSYLFCFVVAGKIDEKKYDQIMEYVTVRMDLFISDYSNE